MWQDFITEFCKVQFLCYGSEPNWLGWIVIGVVGLFLFGIALSLVLFVLEKLSDLLPSQR